MCGFIGVLGPNRAEVEAAATQAMAAIRHRGPDDFGHATVALGSHWLSVAHTRLSILDLTADGRQPMIRGDLPPGSRATQVPGSDEVGLVFNGEIYNFPELHAQLEDEKPTQAFRSRCDTEAILHGVARHGLDFVKRLRGMFSIALWEPAHARLHLVRDRLGIKPLYHAQVGPNLVFGSEVRALLATGLVPRTLDRVGLERFLTFGACQDPYTMLEGVRGLEPAHILTIEPGRSSSPRRYWQLPVKVDHSITLDDAVSETRRLLREAVECHLLSDVQVGAFLSGGVDSSVVVALMAQARSGAQHAITVVSDDGHAESRSERDYASLVAQRYGIQHHTVHLSGAIAESHTRQALVRMDQPSVDGPNTFIVSRATREIGCTVALSGLGADEIFNGYSSFQTLPRLSQMARWRGVGAASERLRELIPATNVRGTKLAEMLASGGDTAAIVALQRMIFFPRLRSQLLRPEYRAPVGAPVDIALSPEELPDDPLNFISALELRGYLQNMLLRDSDAMSMANSLELRVPFLDHRLVEFALSLPGSFKSNLFQRKALLLRSMKFLLPPAVYKRPKMGFNLALPLWMRTSLRSSIESVLLRESQVFDTQVIAKLWEAFLGGETKLWSRLWALYTLTLWLNRHVFGTAEASDQSEPPRPLGELHELRRSAPGGR